MKNEKTNALKKIVEEVCNVNLDLKTQKREHVNARAICYKILRDFELMSYHFIGKQFNKSHSTVLLCLRDFRYMLLSDAQMKRDYEGILAIWEGEAEEYVEIKPLEIKKQLKYLHEQNKLLNLSLIDVQKKYDKKIKEFESRLTEKNEPYINVTSSR